MAIPSGDPISNNQGNCKLVTYFSYESKRKKKSIRARLIFIDNIFRNIQGSTFSDEISFISAIIQGTPDGLTTDIAPVNTTPNAIHIQPYSNLIELDLDGFPQEGLRFVKRNFEGGDALIQKEEVAFVLRHPGASGSVSGVPWIALTSVPSEIFTIKYLSFRFRQVGFSKR